MTAILPDVVLRRNGDDRMWMVVSVVRNLKHSDYDVMFLLTDSSVHEIPMPLDDSFNSTNRASSFRELDVP